MPRMSVPAATIAPGNTLAVNPSCPRDSALPGLSLATDDIGWFSPLSGHWFTAFWHHHFRAPMVAINPHISTVLSESGCSGRLTALSGTYTANISSGATTPSLGRTNEYRGLLTSTTTIYASKPREVFPSSLSSAPFLPSFSGLDPSFVPDRVLETSANRTVLADADPQIRIGALGGSLLIVVIFLLIIGWKLIHRLFKNETSCSNCLSGDTS